jgi:hypothetical protein
VQRRELVHGALEVRAVVQIGAEHDLRVHPDAGLGQALQPRQDLGRVARLAE